jgi:hypothetical protein
MLEKGRFTDPTQSIDEFQDLKSSESTPAFSTLKPLSVCSCSNAVSPYLTTAQVAQILYVDVKTVQRQMKITEQAGIEVPWVKFGRRILWKKSSIERWVKELEQWQVSEKEAKPPMRLDGEIETTKKGPRHVPIKKQQCNSVLKSKDRRRLGEIGSLSNLAKSLT